ncbi:hypothetical protein OIU77_019519 [Salix suchowensis]|uniref:Uncharacterized protein n=1 Tax=Salix suchowensis TaxID=1278906 RepID=A0ABQ9CGB2_9ROSI|nr:hypothetical protein OIU77_019519 [Salix suchowensis]
MVLRILIISTQAKGGGLKIPLLVSKTKKTNRRIYPIIFCFPHLTFSFPLSYLMLSLNI